MHWMSSLLLLLPCGLAVAQTPGPRGSERSSALEPSRILSEFIDREDPSRWTTDPASALRYRRATRAELTRNRWQPGTFLVETGRLFQAARRGAPGLSILIPLGDEQAKRVRFENAGSFVGPFSVETRARRRGARTRVETRATHATYHRYRSQARMRRGGYDVGGALMVLTSSDARGLSARGTVEGRDVEVVGPGSTWALDDVAAAGGSVDARTLVRVSLLGLPDVAVGLWEGCTGLGICDAYCGYLGGPWDFPDPGPVNAHPCSKPFNPGASVAVPFECADEVDNDGDGDIDDDDANCDGHPHGPSTSSHFHRFESGREFGLFGEGQACTDLAEGWDEEFVDLALSVAGAFRLESESLAEKLRWAVISCWVFDSAAEAEACDDGGPCPDLYPYAGASGDSVAYRSNVAADLWHAKIKGLHVPVSVLNVVHKGVTLVGLEPACGTAFLGAGNPLSGFSVSAIQTGATCAQAWKVAAHEIGHLFGADHEEGPPFVFMVEGTAFTGAGFLPWFSEANGHVVNSCFADLTCPRISDLGTSP